MSQRRAEKVRRRKRRQSKRSRWRENKRNDALIQAKGVGFGMMQELCDVVVRDTEINHKRLEGILNEPEEQSGSEEGTPNEEAVS